MANFSKTKNRGDVHETHPPGLMNKSDENNQRTFFLLQKKSYKRINAFFPPATTLAIDTRIWYTIFTSVPEIRLMVMCLRT